MKKKIIKVLLSALVITTFLGQVSLAAELSDAKNENGVVRIKLQKDNSPLINDEKSLKTIEKISNLNEKGSIENIDSDDGELPISLDEYLDLKDKFQPSQFFVKENIPNKYTETPNGLKIYETDFEWNGDLNLTNEPNTIILHHIEASRPGQTIPVTDIDAWHKANTWAGIGYHFYITKNGDIFRGRPENAIGAHAKSHNVNTLGIAVEGKYETETMPKAQEEAVIKLGQYLRRKYKINTILRHKDVNSTDCPGKNYPFTEVKNSILSYPVTEPVKPEVKPEVKPPLKNQDFTVEYQSKVEGNGWQGYKENGEVSGTTGQAKMIEGIKINLNNAPEGVALNYKVHVSDEGWKNWISEGKVAGSSDLNKRIEAIQIKLIGNHSQDYEVQYRAHVQDIGWMPWKKNGEVAGTTGQAKRIEAIEIKVVPSNKLGVKYDVHGEDYGWQSTKYNGQLGGTTGQCRRVEGIKISLTNKGNSDLGIRYKSHVQDIGWQDWVSEGELSGTTGKSKQMEAIQIELQGKDSSKHNIEYRVHVKDIGWMPWKKNGEVAGTIGQNKRIEAIEIRID
ncbi:N-acetylmuramoyl-L-alanine amidase [Clostridium perfringens]|nr:N-acetylmuramoyl-L-alanine amidase [Clostridium perfringens]